MRRLGVAITAVLMLMAAAGPACAVTVTLGPPSLPGSATSIGCSNSSNCGITYAQVAVSESGATSVSPGDGTVIAWRAKGTRVGGTTYICPRVIRRTSSTEFTGVASPGGVGVANDSRCIATQSPHLDGTTTDLQTGSMPIHVGDIMGVTVESQDIADSAKIQVASAASAVFDTFNSILGPTPTAPSATDAQEMQVQFDVQLDAPAVTGIAPTSGPSTGGTSVTITGQHLANVSAVTFGGTPATITADSNSQVTATAPAHAAGPVDVQVSVPGGTSPATAADQFTYVDAGGTGGGGGGGGGTVLLPVVTGLNPASGPATGGTTVTILGNRLSGATAVLFGSTPAVTFSGDDVHIVAIAPPGAGKVDVRVTTPSGTSTASDADAFTYVVPPDTTKPKLSSLRITPARFQAANIGGPVASRLRVGGKVAYKLSEPATITFTIQLRKGRAYKAVRGSFVRTRKAAGADSFVFTGRLRGRTLQPGHYRLSLRAKDAAGNASAAVRAPFRIG